MLRSVSVPSAPSHPRRWQKAPARRGLCPPCPFRLSSVLRAGLLPEGARPARPAILLLALGLILALASPSRAAISIDKSNLDFGSQNVCTTSAPLQVTVSSDGADTNSAINPHFTLTGPDAGDFAARVSEVVGSSRVGSGTLEVTFTPTATGARTATLNITVSSVVLTVQLSGTGTGTMPPVSLSCPLPTLVFNPDPGACQASGIDPPAPKATGPCDTISVAGARSDSLPLTDPYPVGATIITWTAIDTSGHRDTCTQLVTVVDNQPPAITAPQALTVNVDAGLCTASNVALGTPTRGDNCPSASVTNDAPSSFPSGSTTVTWTVTDASGMRATATQKVTVVDNQPPSITAPPDVTVSTDAGQCTASGVSLGTPARGDNCGVMSVTNDAPATFSPGTTTVTWTVTDTSGNQAAATQKVTVNDTEKPTFAHCPPSGATGIATCTASGIGATVSFSPVIATGACGGTPTVSYDHQSGSFFPPGNTTVTATALGASGTSTTCPFTVTVAYAWSGVLQPINADGSSVFKAGSTVPVKFALAGASACLTGLAATLGYAKVSDGVAGGVNEAVSTSQATAGNLFRYDASAGQYIFNWNTKGLAVGTYLLRIDLGDGVTRSVTVGLR